jgi:hypothetical protein
MPKAEQITTEEFDRDLTIYRDMSPDDLILVSKIIDVLRREMPIRQALREALERWRYMKSLAASEYEDAIEAQDIYREVRDGS